MTGFSPHRVYQGHLGYVSLWLAAHRLDYAGLLFMFVLLSSQTQIAKTFLTIFCLEPEPCLDILYCVIFLLCLWQRTR